MFPRIFPFNLFNRPNKKPHAIWSTHLVVSTYTGYALRLSDNASGTTDVPFLFGELDAVTAQTAIDAGQTQVTTWYEQSGGGRDLSNGTFATMPTLELNALPSHRPTIRFASGTFLETQSNDLNDIWYKAGYMAFGIKYRIGSGVKNFLINCKETLGNFSFPMTDGSTAYHALEITYDSSNNNNTPTVKVDGAGVAVTTVTKPDGDRVVSNTNHFRIGSDQAGSNSFDGDLWDLYVYGEVP